VSTARSRARNYWPKLRKQSAGGTAPDGMSAMKHAWDWILSEIRQLDEQRPADAEEARWHVAEQIGKVAELLPKRTRGAR
jgi:hypothetical protein